MSHRHDPRYPNAVPGPSRLGGDRPGGQAGEAPKAVPSNSRLYGPPTTTPATGGTEQGGGRAPSRATTLLREYQMQEQQRRQAVESARPPVAQTLAHVVQRLGAQSGIAMGPARAKPDKPPVWAAVKPIGQHTNGPTAQMATKSAQSAYRQPPLAGSGSNAKTTSPVTHVAKSVNTLILPWQEQDELRESRVRSNKRAREANGFADDEVPARRVARIATVNPRLNALRQRRVNDERVELPRPPKALLDPRMALRVEGEVIDEGPGSSESQSSESGMDVDDEPLVPRPSVAGQTARKSARMVPINGSPRSAPSPSPELPSMGRKSTVMKKVATAKKGVFIAAKKKAARKREIVPTDSESESEDESDGDGASSSSSTSCQSSHELAEDSQDEEDEVHVKQEEEDGRSLRSFGPPELVILDSPPPITIPLPQIDSEYSLTVFPPRLLSALSAFALTPIRLHEKRHLPFLLRNLRRGFHLRCKSLGVSLDEDVGNVTLSVRYQHVDDVQYQALLRKWSCPICSLHGEFPNQLVLAKHLSWDHSELFIEWQKHNATSWTVNILVPEVVSVARLDESEANVPAVNQAASGGTQPVPSVPLPSVSPVPANRRETLFPFVALSPPASPRSSTFSSAEPATIPPVSPTPETSASPAPFNSPTPFGDIKGKGKQSRYHQPTPSTATPSFRSQSTTTATSTADRSSTAATTTTARMPSSAFVGRDGKRYPTPPPPDDPLGPSARKPYLPAEPIYPGGQTVYYSCRPGGATLYDLLNTLPMEQFGVLDWAVLDREEEIFESDEVKDEYKVMHALWARWIFLNRTRFLANYYKGAVSFVDEFWEMIHRAAGWDALRYWLLVLLANRYLNAKEVATILKHYEAYTGMDYWNE